MTDWHIWVRKENAGGDAVRVLTVDSGRRIIELQTSQALINSPQKNQWPRDSQNRPMPDEFGRRPFLHPALSGLQGLTDEAEAAMLSKERLAQIGERYGLDKVTRWTPKNVRRETAEFG